MANLDKKENCGTCGKVVYPTERLAADEQVFHKGCFRCSKCNNVMKLGSFASMNGVFFCKPCFKKNFFSKGNYSSGFGKLTPQQEHDQKAGKIQDSNGFVSLNSSPEEAKQKAPAQDLHLPAAKKTSVTESKRSSLTTLPPKKEEPKSMKLVEVKKEEPKPVKKEEPKPTKKEDPKPVEVKKEEPKPVKKEEPKPVEVKKEEPKPVEVKKEEPKKEEPKPVEVKKEEPKKEEPKPTEIKKEEPKPVEVKKEEPKKEEPKPTEIKKEEPKPVKKEDPKPVEVKKEVPKPIETPKKEEVKPTEQVKKSIEPIAKTQGVPPKKTNNCQVCQKAVYPMEEIKANDSIFHKGCFRCKNCNSVLVVGSFASLEGQLFCKPCFKKAFFTKGDYSAGFGKQTPQQEHDTKTGVQTKGGFTGTFAGVDVIRKAVAAPAPTPNNTPTKQEKSVEIPKEVLESRIPEEVPIDFPKEEIIEAPKEVVDSPKVVDLEVKEI